MLCRVLAKRRCLKVTGFLVRYSSDDARASSDARYFPLPTFSEVGSSIADKIKNAGTGHYVHVTGQFYDHDSTLTRNLVMKINEDKESEEFDPQVVLDAALSDSEIKILTNILVDSAECRHVSAGEIDCVGSEDWKYGYLLSPNFTLFSTDSILLRQDDQNRELLYLNSRPCNPVGHKVWMKDIENVYVNLSPRPWTTHTLGFRTLSEKVTLLDYERLLDVRNEDLEAVEPSHEELGELMIHTEWIVKTGAQLVFAASQNRFKNANIPLYVPRVLQADVNPWVEMRNSLWENQLADKLERSRTGYIP